MLHLAMAKNLRCVPEYAAVRPILSVRRDGRRSASRPATERRRAARQGGGQVHGGLQHRVVPGWHSFVSVDSRRKGCEQWDVAVDPSVALYVYVSVSVWHLTLSMSLSSLSLSPLSLSHSLLLSLLLLSLPPSLSPSLPPSLSLALPPSLPPSLSSDFVYRRWFSKQRLSQKNLKEC